MRLCGRIFKKMPPTPFCTHPAPKSCHKVEPLFSEASEICAGQLGVGFCWVIFILANHMIKTLLPSWIPKSTDIIYVDIGLPDLSFLIFFSLIWRLYSGRHRRAACLWRRHEPAGRDCFLGHGVWQRASNLHQGDSVSSFNKGFLATLLFTISVGVPLQRLVGS